MMNLKERKKDGSGNNATATIKRYFLFINNQAIDKFMKKTVKPSTRRQKIKTRESVCDELGMSLSEMYLKLERAKTNHFMQEYSYKLQRKLS